MNININMSEEEFIITAYTLIHRETRRFDRKSNDAELANYVKGIIDLQTELYKNAQRMEALKSETETEIENPFD